MFPIHLERIIAITAQQEQRPQDDPIALALGRSLLFLEEEAENIVATTSRTLRPLIALVALEHYLSQAAFALTLSPPSSSSATRTPSSAGTSDQQSDADS